ncbi:hypothetical protein N7537_009555 [Penicillium hordei]|uniref:Uncharacterized protein n=1 Tax=Penicillium hordei TaxID=40994 RepID=A0AAD6GUV7_9EURO|nr:uncharacterized protein N7537_009555 [Penicillium hordei]KAJ5592651.1 hypothetical protein N7537_009555 [Penicillium hordei]
MTRRTRIPFCNILRVRDPPPRVEPVEPVEPKKFKTLWKISSEIVEIIFQLLSDLDRACFALSYSVAYVSYQHCLGRYYFVAFKTSAGYTVLDVKIFTGTLDGSF